MNSQKKWSIVLFLLIFSTVLLAADDFLVTYAEGKVEVKSGAAWKRVAVGDLLPDTGEVRLGADGLLQLKLKNDTLTVYQSGTFALKNFIQPARERKSSRLFAAVDEKMKNVAGQPGGPTKSMAAGVKGRTNVRGAADDSGPAWSGDTTDAIAEGRALIAEEKYKDAVDYFLATLRAEHDPAAESELYYYLALACDRSGETARALKYADSIVLRPEDPGYEDFALLKGSLYVKGFSYAKALAVFDRYLAAFPAGANAQDVLLLSAYCCKNTGDAKKQKAFLQQAVRIDPESDAGKEAAAQLKDLK
jgi:tetratricopeptide (TPR) repeat protein